MLSFVQHRKLIAKATTAQSTVGEVARRRRRQHHRIGKLEGQGNRVRLKELSVGVYDVLGACCRIAI